MTVATRVMLESKRKTFIWLLFEHSLYGAPSFMMRATTCCRFGARGFRLRFGPRRPRRPRCVILDPSPDQGLFVFVLAQSGKAILRT
jgi:hypothetical protein